MSVWQSWREGERRAEERRDESMCSLPHRWASILHLLTVEWRQRCSRGSVTDATVDYCRVAISPYPSPAICTPVSCLHPHLHLHLVFGLSLVPIQRSLTSYVDTLLQYIIGSCYLIATSFTFNIGVCLLANIYFLKYIILHICGGIYIKCKLFSIYF